MTTVKNSNPKGLRKCTLSYMKDDVFYFHKWAEQGQVQRHPEDPQKDTTFASTYGIVECVKTGKIRCPEPNNITFLP